MIKTSGMRYPRMNVLKVNLWCEVYGCDLSNQIFSIFSFIRLFFWLFNLNIVVRTIAIYLYYGIAIYFCIILLHKGIVVPIKNCLRKHISAFIEPEYIFSSKKFYMEPNLTLVTLITAKSGSSFCKNCWRTT